MLTFADIDQFGNFEIVSIADNLLAVGLQKRLGGLHVLFLNWKHIIGRKLHTPSGFCGSSHKSRRSFSRHA